MLRWACEQFPAIGIHSHQCEQYTRGEYSRQCEIALKAAAAADDDDRWSEKSAGREVWCGQEVKDLPCYKLAALQSHIFASYSGPDSGLELVHEIEQHDAERSGELCHRGGHIPRQDATDVNCC